MAWSLADALLVAVAASFLYADQKLDLIPLPLPAPAGTAKLIDSSYMPKKPAGDGVFANNTLLKDTARRLFEGKVQNPETVTFDAEGRLYTIDSGNFLRRGKHKGAEAELEELPVLHLGAGQGLALEFDGNGDLIICIAGAGLFKLDMATHQLSLLTARVSPDSALEPNTAIAYAEDLDIASDGTIYFTDGTDIPPLPPHFDILKPVDLAVLAGAMKGRLLSYDPPTRKTTVLASGFWLANGCALSKDESFVLVSDTVAARIVKYHLKGPKAGSTEIILDGLPGHPDNVRAARDGTFWVALAANLRAEMLPVLPSKHVRALVAWAPSGLLPKDKPAGAVVQITGEGRVLRYLWDPKGETLAFTTSVAEGETGLYIGSFARDYVGFVDYADLQPPFPHT